MSFMIHFLIFLVLAASTAQHQIAYRMADQLMCQQAVQKHQVAPSGLHPPNNSNESNQIEAIITHQSTTSGYGGMTVYIYIPYILFKDGTIYSDLNVSPYDPAIKKLRASEPKKWGRWQYRGKEIQIQWDDKAKTEVWGAGSWYPATPAKKSDRLQGYFGSRMMAGNGSIASTAVKGFNFTADGRFSASGTTAVVNGVFSRSSRSKQLTGTYTLDGYSIEFRFDDGRVERKGFYYKTRTWIGIGNGLYMQ